MAVGEWGDRPLLLAVDADARLLGRIEGELQRAFGADFRVRGELLPEDAVRTLHGAKHRQERVALVLVDDSLSDDARAEIFEVARGLHPNARRALLAPVHNHGWRVNRSASPGRCVTTLAFGPLF